MESQGRVSYKFYFVRGGVCYVKEKMVMDALLCITNPVWWTHARPALVRPALSSALLCLHSDLGTIAGHGHYSHFLALC